MPLRFVWAASLLSLLAVSPARAGEPPDAMSYLDNGKIRLGVDLRIGGAVTWLSASGKADNMINSCDWGRQVQMSFYSGPVPFQPEGTTLAPNWAGLGWNPIQAGDTYHNGSKVIEHRNDGKTIYVKCVPMIWPLKNVPAECTFECEYRLEGAAVEACCRLSNARSDKTQYAGRNQELPAVYTNGPWYKLVTYLGDRPFSDAPTATLVDRDDGKGWPWLNFYTPEHWAALLDKDDRGLGVFQADAYGVTGGFHSGPKGRGGAKDAQTGYAAPVTAEILDHNIRYEYRYVLIVGTLGEIRRYAAEHSAKAKRPKWVFSSDRAHWIYEGTTDAGWPIEGELRVKLQEHGAALVSPPTFWRADDASKLQIEAAFDRNGGEPAAGNPAAGQCAITLEPFSDQEQRAWEAWGPAAARPAKKQVGPVPLRLTADGQYRVYTALLAGTPGYQGAMIHLRVHLPGGTGTVRVKRVELVR
ncbi:MAG: hypothetical protein ACYC35_12120 [Pirellulales bacterium]